MAVLLTGLTSLFTGGAAAATAATTAPAASGLSLASILQGSATVLGVLTSFGAGAAEEDRLEAEAIDAKREESLESLQGIQRRASIKRAMVDALGAQDVAYAASGVDLSFGTASQARQDAYREADLALTSDAATQETRQSRLRERAANYRRGAKQARLSGLIDGLSTGLRGAASMAERW